MTHGQQTGTSAARTQTTTEFSHFFRPGLAALFRSGFLSYSEAVWALSSRTGRGYGTVPQTSRIEGLKLVIKAGNKCTTNYVLAAEDIALPVHSTSVSVELSVTGKRGTLTITCTDAGGENTAQVNIE